jgi:phosphatidate cytidylyltransferase
VSATQASSGSRAGRNLPMAAAVGVALAALVLISLYTYSWLFVVLAACAIAVAVHEVVGALRSTGYDVALVPAVTGAVVMLVAAYVRGIEALLVAFALTVMALVVVRLAGAAEHLTPDLDAAVLVTIWVPLLASFAMLMLAQSQGADRVLVFVLVTVMSDIGGYVAGVLLGRHKMAPHVSPKKSWEGFAGSLIACALAGAVVLPVLLSAPAWQGVVFGAVVAVSATLGDLGESLLKRDLQIKDMGTILPGHGGLMDRLDSLLPTAPVAFVLLTWIMK